MIEMLIMVAHVDEMAHHGVRRGKAVKLAQNVETRFDQRGEFYLQFFRRERSEDVQQIDLHFTLTEIVNIGRVNSVDAGKIQPDRNSGQPSCSQLKGARWQILPAAVLPIVFDMLAAPDQPYGQG